MFLSLSFPFLFFIYAYLPLPLFPPIVYRPITSLPPLSHFVVFLLFSSPLSRPSLFLCCCSSFLSLSLSLFLFASLFVFLFLLFHLDIFFFSRRNMLNVSIYRSFIFLVFLFVLFIRFCSGDFVLSARVLICRYVTRFPLFHSRRVPLSLCSAVPLFLSPCFPKFPCPCTTWSLYSQILESPSSPLLLFPCFCALTPSNYSPICMFFPLSFAAQPNLPQGRGTSSCENSCVPRPVPRSDVHSGRPSIPPVPPAAPLSLPYYREIINTDISRVIT